MSGCFDCDVSSHVANCGGCCLVCLWATSPVNFVLCFGLFGVILEVYGSESTNKPGVPVNLVCVLGRGWCMFSLLCLRDVVNHLGTFTQHV